MKQNIETLAVHGGQAPDKTTRSCAVPIYQTTAYAFDSTEYASALFDLREPGNIYTRLMNPTTDVLEQRITILEGGVGAVAVSSGMSAILATVLTLASSGDEIVTSPNIYGGTHTLFAHTLKRYGITAVFTKTDKPEDFERAITEKTRLVFGETISNPSLNVLDIEGVANVAHKHGIPFVIDNTVTTPILIKPLEFGADIVVHSATKYLGGHGNSMGGVIVDGGKFEWNVGAAKNKFPQLTQPDESYHGVTYTESFGSAAFIARVRCSALRDMGFCISPFNSFMILQGVETLALRMKQHCENATKVVKFLQNSPHVAWVKYPKGEHTEKYLKNGFGAMIGFGIKGCGGLSAKEVGAKFIDNAKLLTHVANIGDTRSLVIHPASTTHQQLNPQQLAACGISDDYIRLSIGIENAEDIIADIEQALETACK